MLYWWDKRGVTWFLRGKQVIKAANANLNFTGALFIDLRKAFDSVPHKEVLPILKRFGFGDNSINLFTSYLYDRFQAVSLDNEFSGPFAVVSGVPQGSGFSRGLPFLMIVYKVIPVSYILLSQFRI